MIKPAICIAISVVAPMVAAHIGYGADPAVVYGLGVATGVAFMAAYVSLKGSAQ